MSDLFTTEACTDCGAIADSDGFMSHTHACASARAFWGEETRTAPLSVSFGPVDPMNPQCGYELRITRQDGSTLLFTGCDPVTGANLLSVEDCLRVVSYYVVNGAPF